MSIGATETRAESGWRFSLGGAMVGVAYTAFALTPFGLMALLGLLYGSYIPYYWFFELRRSYPPPGATRATLVRGKLGAWLFAIVIGNWFLIPILTDGKHLLPARLVVLGLVIVPVILFGLILVLRFSEPRTAENAPCEGP